MAKPLGKTFVEIDIDDKKYKKGIVDVKTTTKKKLSEIERAWKGLGKKSEATYDDMRAAINKNYDKIKRHSASTADDIFRAEKAKNEKISRINRQQFGEQKSLLDKAKKHWMAFSAIAIAAVYAIGRAGIESLSMYADWEVALQRLGNVSDETIPEMREKILSISPALGTVTELTEGYYAVLSAGVTEPLAAMDLLTTAAKLSKEATIEQDEAVKGLVSVMGSYSTELTTAKDAANLLYGIEKLGITTVGELTPLIGNLANMSMAAGLSADEMAAALAQITTTGAGTSISVTQLQSLLTALSKKFALLPPEVKKYRSATAAVKALGFQGVLKEIMEATGGNSTALIKMLGRQEAYLALLQLSKNEFGDYSGKLEDMTDKAGLFDDAWKRYSITLTAIWDTFKNTIGKQAVLIGEDLAPAIKKVITKASEWFTANQAIITQNMATVIGGVVTAVEGLATAYDRLQEAYEKGKSLAEALGLKAVIKASDDAKKELDEGLMEAVRELQVQMGITGDEAIKSYAKMKIPEDVLASIKEVSVSIDESTAAALKEEQAMIKARIALEDNNAAMIAFASSIEVAAEKEEVLIAVFDLSIASIKAGEKAYQDHIKMVDKREKAIYDATIAAKDAEKKYTDYVVKLGEKGYKEHKQRMKDQAKATKDAAIDSLHAYESMYRDLKGYGADYHAVQELLIEEQREKYIEMTGDIVAADAWAAQEHKRLAREKALESDSFFAGMKVGWQDMVDEQETWAEHGRGLFDDVRGAWKANVDIMVDDFIKGERDKRNVAEITRDILSDVAGQTSKRMYAAAINKIIELIGAQLGMGAAGAGAAGSMKGGVTGALAEIGLYLSVGVGAMLAGRVIAEQFAAGGGWIGSHPQGGVIRGGSGMRDDVLLGHTPGTRHWGIGGEFVINKESTARHGALLEAINRDRGMMTGGYIDRAYQEGGLTLPWESAADALAIGGMMSFLHGWYKGAGPISGLAELGTFMATAIPAMFVGKFVASQFRASGGMIDAGHGLGDFLSAPLSPITEGLDFIGDILPGPLGDLVESLGDTAVGKLQAIINYLDYRAGMMLEPDKMWEMIKDLIRTPLEAVAKDLVTPNVYHSDPLDTISTIVDYLKSEAFQAERDLIGELISFKQGGRIPRTGLFYGHKDERVLNKEETKAYEHGKVIHVHLNLDGREVGLAIVKDGDVIEQMDYQLTKRNKRVYA